MFSYTLRSLFFFKFRLGADMYILSYTLPKGGPPAHARPGAAVLPHLTSNRFLRPYLYLAAHKSCDMHSHAFRISGGIICHDCSLDSKSFQKHNMQIFRGTRPSLSQTGADYLWRLASFQIWTSYEFDPCCNRKLDPGPRNHPFLVLGIRYGSKLSSSVTVLSN